MSRVYWLMKSICLACRSLVTFSLLARADVSGLWSVDGEVSTDYVELKVFDALVDCLELTVVGTVARLRSSQSAREETNGLESFVGDLVQCGSDGCVASICIQGQSLCVGRVC